MLCTFFPCFQSSEHQEYEYLLKWKGYGEEENSWVPASSMNCWDLLQAYLSENIFNNPSAVSHSTSADSRVDPASQKSSQKTTRTPKLKQCEERPRCANRAKHSIRPRSGSRHSSRSTKNSRGSLGAHSSEKDKAGTKKATTQFSPPKLPPSSAKCTGQRQATLNSQTTKSKARCTLKPKKLTKRTDICCPEPSVSPLLAGDDSLFQSDGNVSIEDTFRLHLDSDEDSSVSGSHSVSGESTLTASEVSHVCRHPRSPKAQLHLYSSQQKRVNGFKDTYLLPHQNDHKLMQKHLPSSTCSNERLLLTKRNGFTHNLPSSTTHSTTENSSDSVLWSRARSRKRAYSSLLAPSFESNTLKSSSSSDHAEVTSTTSPPLNTISLSPSLPHSLPIASHIMTSPGPLVPQKQNSSDEYQQELLEWQFMLNKQCLPSETFILVENRIDEAPIPWSFKYITSNLYTEGVPDPQSAELSRRICGCTCYYMGKKCGPKSQHCCPQMAGAEFPYSVAGKVRVPPGNPIYECNSHCGCPSDCTNRVVQRGRKVTMCIFRTSNGRGWGVKTMEPIKPNTFVTEYVGEVVTTEEAERRGQLYDREGRTYLFDLDFHCDDNAFTIDAARYGNISHFFNHSVSDS